MRLVFLLGWLLCNTTDSYTWAEEAYGMLPADSLYHCSIYNKHFIDSAVRNDKLAFEKQRALVLAYFSKLQGLYKDALIPVSDIDGLSLVAISPNLLAHELVHFQQTYVPDEHILLQAVLKEGMADFIGEMISGKTADERLFRWAKGREMQLWRDFTNDMYQDKVNDWMADSNEKTQDKPADIGCWIGYQICQAYYENSKNKQQAIYDMLHIKNYKAFYEKSNAETWIRKNKEE
jgi:hypothetical protein